MTDETPPPKPFVMAFEDDTPADPALAPAVPDLGPEADHHGHAMQMAARISARRGSALGSWLTWAFGALFSLVLSVAAYDFVTGLLARNAVLGGIAFALLLASVAGLLLFAMREWSAYARLSRLDSLRDRAATAHSTGDLASAKSVVTALQRLYAGREDTSWGRARLSDRATEVFDADALLDLAETELLAPLDALARAEVETAARQVATVTALVPMALADVATALFANLRMIRRIAEIYGGRSGSFGSWRLLRRVFTSLVATGAMALTDDLIGSVAGGGVLSKLSRRFGEGVVNGALTARVGVAAIELCRPMPFRAEGKPKVTALVSRALTGLFSPGKDAKP